MKLTTLISYLVILYPLTVTGLSAHEYPKIKCFFTDTRVGRDIYPLESGDSIPIYVFDKKHSINNCFKYTFNIDRFDDGRQLYKVKVRSEKQSCKSETMIPGDTVTKRYLKSPIHYIAPYTFQDLRDIMFTALDLEPINKPINLEDKRKIQGKTIVLTNLVCALFNESEWNKD